MEGGMIRWGCITRGRPASCYSMHGEGEFCSVMNSVGIMYIGFVFQCVLYEGTLLDQAARQSIVCSCSISYFFDCPVVYIQ